MKSFADWWRASAPNRERSFQISNFRFQTGKIRARFQLRVYMYCGRWPCAGDSGTPRDVATYERFEELPVWNTAADLFDRVDDFLEQAPPRLRPTFRAQLERAALSVSNNISEGFERGSTKELLAYIYIARGSSGEVRSMLRVAARRPWMPRELLPVIEAIISTAISCSRQLRAWAGSLQRSSIKGHRHIDVPTAAKPAKRKGASNSLKFEI